MSKNKIFSILVLFLALFMVACVVNAASDHITVSDANDGNNTLKISNDLGTKESTLNTSLENKNVENNGDSVSNDGESNDTNTSYTQLAEDIKNSGGVLELTHDYAYDPTKDSSYKNGISISKDLIINGNNHIIDGSNTSRVFYIYSGTLTINNLTVTNCSNSYKGGAIRNDNSGSLIISCSSFINCSGSTGGAIYNYAGGFNVTGSSFINCSSTDYGGAICNGGSGLNVVDSSFINCSGSNGGAICNLLFSSLNVIDSSFINCSSSSYGGAIFNYEFSILNVNSSSFINCSSDYGGAIYADGNSISISNSTFNNNHAKTEGGTIWSNKDVNVSNSSFTDNICSGAIIMQCEGGAIYSDADDVTIENSSFIRNYADDYGGAIYADDGVTTNNCLFENNTANDNDGGALYADDESVNISNSTFNNNHANSKGGAVWSNKEVNVINSLFTDNSCSGAIIINSKGGAIYSDENGVTIENSSFIRNNVASFANYGGAVWSDDNITVNNSLFENNTANGYYGYGGALYADDESVRLSNSTFIGNRAEDFGGVFYDNGMHENDFDYVCDCNINDNSAGKRGGAIYMDSYSSYITLTGNAIYNNSAGTGEGLDVYTYGFFYKIYGNWWGTNNPDWSKHLLYEHRTFGSNKDHEDSNPLNYNPFGNTTIIVASDMEIPVNTTKNLTATLKDENDNLLANKKVIFTFKGSDYTRTTDANGEAKLTITSSDVGSYPVTISFAGDDNYESSNVSVTVKVNAVYVTISQIMDSAVNLNNYITNYGVVPSTVTVNGVKYTTAQFTYLLSAALKNINASKSVSTKIEVINVTATNVNYKVNITATKDQYLSVVNTIYSKAESGTLPSYVSVGGEKVGFNTYTYALSRALAFYKNNNRLPNSLLFTSYF